MFIKHKEELHPGDIIASVVHDNEYENYIVEDVNEKFAFIRSIGITAENRSKEIGKLLGRLVTAEILLPAKPLEEYKVIEVNDTWLQYRKVILIKEGKQ